MKKIISLFLVLITLFGLASCNVGGGNNNGDNTLAGTYDIKVWVSNLEGVAELTKKQIDDFELANPGIMINATVEGVSEGDAATNMLTDVEAGADIFCFAQDQLSRLWLAGALAKPGKKAQESIREMNDSGAVSASAVGGEILCYPLTSDNGYFMFYDKSVVDEAHIDSLEDILADCKAKKRAFAFNLEGSGWYTASFFFGAGCKSVWETDKDANFVSVDDDFKSDAGVIAMKGMNKVTSFEYYISDAEASVFDNSIPAGVLISGAWNAGKIKAKLGENYGATDLPSFTVDGKSYHLGSFSGNKLMGVKPQKDEKRATVLQLLAMYLTGEACQKERYEKAGFGPSNKEAQKMDALKENPALSALAMQSEYATPQGQIHASWWVAVQNLATVSKKNPLTDAEINAALNKYDEAVRAMVSSEKTSQ